jgi:hypothetical protein
MPTAPPPFDFLIAQQFVNRLHHATHVLDGALGTRRLMAHLATTHWEGQFRAEFDQDHAYSMRRGAESLERLRHLTRQVSEAVTEAHSRQQAHRVAMHHYSQQVQDYHDAVEAQRLERLERVRLAEAQRAAQQRAQQQADDFSRRAAGAEAA